jgi:hypothetical protein
MDRAAPEYPQSGLPTPYPRAFTGSRSEDHPADPASAAQYAPQQEGRPSSYPAAAAAATPSASEYGVYPSSARSATFPDPVQRPYQPAASHAGSTSAVMAQPTNPAIAASSPTYPPQHGGQYSPYPPQQDLQHPYQAHGGGAMYSQPRPDWAGYGGHPQHALPGYPVTGAQTPNAAAPAGARAGQVGYPVATHPGHQHPHQVYSFVPIPGAQQHKRPRRRYEEIERMYKCGWNGCEKAYGTLNHLNAHVTMQSHGTKRTPEEFKEIRKEWKARKKEEENQRKADDDRARAAAGTADPQAASADAAAAAPGYQQQPGRSVQLPPIGYQPGAQVPGQYQAPAGGVQQLQEYGSGHLQYSGYPASPYGAPNQMYSQHNSGSAPKYDH